MRNHRITAPRGAGLRKSASWVLLGAFLLAGCGEGGGAAQAPGTARAVDRPDWQPVVPRGERHLERVVSRLEIPLGLAPWTVTGERARVEESGGQRRLLLLGDEPKTLTIPGPIVADSVDEIRLVTAAQARSQATLQLEFLDGSKRVLRQQEFGGTTEPTPLALELKRSAPPEVTVDQFSLHVTGLGPQALFGAIELVDVPTASGLPDPGPQLPLVKLGGDDRRAFGLAPERAVGARVELAPGSVLRLAAGAAPGVEFEGMATVHMRVRSDSGELVERPVELRFNGAPSWRAAGLDLGTLPAGAAELELELIAPPGSDAACWIADPRIVVPDPNADTVLLVTSDTHRADHLGSSAPGGEVSTPALDALAVEGILFEDCFTSANVTNPSHIALMTGVHPRDTGVHGNDTAVAEEASTLAERFAAAGYSTLASISVRHLAPDISGLGQGFLCAASPAAQRDAKETVAKLERWLDEREGEPVFAWLHLFDAHEPYIPPPEYAAKFYPDKSSAFDPAKPPLEVPEEFYSRHFPGLRDLEYPKAMYRAEIASLDAELGRLFARPRVRDGLIVVTADHGESLGEHGVYYGHAGLFPQTIHVPLILRGPGVPVGERVSSPVRQIDVGRTVLELAGLDAAGFPGENLVANRDVPRTEPRYAIGANRDSASITIGGWHLLFGLRTYTPTGALRLNERHAVELYDLDADPACTEELSERELERARRMRDLLLKWLVSSDGVKMAGEVHRNPQLTAQLAELGYTTSDDGSDSSELVDEGCDCKHCLRFR